MANRIKVEGKTLDEAINKATIELGVSSDRLKYNVIEKGNAGLFGILGSKSAIIEAWKELSMEDKAVEFIENILEKMNIAAKIEVQLNEEEKTMEINMIGTDMGVLIGKRGQTLDSLQYLVSIVVNKLSEDFIRVRLDTENYRERRKETLENLAKSIANKVRKTRRAIKLEPMNPYERRIIHSALQDENYIITKSDGEEPYRHVVVLYKNNRSNNY